MEPVIDLHCDLLSYLGYNPGADPDSPAIGCSLPALRKGNVKLQVMAIYTATEPGSTKDALQQSLLFRELLSKHSDRVMHVQDTTSLEQAFASEKTGIVASIENASGLCEEGEPIGHAFQNLEKFTENTGRILYIGLTHHEENRFGGGNSSTAGLKNDGKAMLDFMHGKKIAVDFSHTSDALAHDILDHITRHSLDIPIIASHSNFRKVYQHPRNLPDEIALEIHKRKGLIGMNFLRAFLHLSDPASLYGHISYGVKLGLSDSICFGADYFFASSPDPARVPYYFGEQETAACYPSILGKLNELFPEKTTQGIAHANAAAFIKRIWS